MTVNQLYAIDALRRHIYCTLTAIDALRRSLNRPIYIHSSVVQPTMSGLWLAYHYYRLGMASGLAAIDHTEVIGKFIHSLRS